MHVNWSIVHPQQENVTALIVQRRNEEYTYLALIYIDGKKIAGHYVACEIDLDTIYYLMSFYMRNKES